MNYYVKWLLLNREVIREGAETESSVTSDMIELDTVISRLNSEGTLSDANIYLLYNFGSARFDYSKGKELNTDNAYRAFSTLFNKISMFLPARLSDDAWIARLIAEYGLKKEDAMTLYENIKQRN